MDPARAERQRIAVESLMADPLTRKIYMGFLRASQSLGAFKIDDVLADTQFAFHRPSYDFFVANRDKLLPVLKDALPDFSIREKPRPVMAEEAPPEKRVYVFTFPESELEKIPADLKTNVRSLGRGMYVIEGERDLLDKLNLGSPPAGAPPKSGDTTPLGTSRFTIKRSEMSNDISRYKELQEEAEKVGQLVEIVD